MANNLQAQVDILGNEIKRLKRRLARSRQIEHSLRKSERRYRTIFDNTIVGLAQLGLDGRFLTANLPFCRLVGYEREALYRTNNADLTHPDDRELDLRIQSQLIDTRKQQERYEKRYVRKDGTAVWASVNLSLAQRGENGVPCILMVAEDISERRALQESLRRIAINLARMDEVTPLGSWKWNIKTGRIKASDEAFDLFAVDKHGQSVTLQTLLERIHPDDRARVERALLAAKDMQKPYQIEYRLLLPDGSVRLISSNGEVYRRDAQGVPTVIIGMVQDVTLRRQAEDALRESEERFRALFDEASDGIFIADQEGVYTDVNRSACSLLGYRREELVGNSIGNLIPEEDVPRLSEARSFILRSVDNVQVDEWKLRRKDGDYLETEISARMLPDGRWMAIVRDISERKKTQASLARSADEIRDLYDNAPCGYHSLDGDGNFVRINNTELDWIGFNRDELVGSRRFADLLTEESRRIYIDRLETLHTSGKLRDVELEVVRKDGSIMPALLNATASFDASGACLSTRASLFDITALSEANKRLRQAAAVFEHTNDAIIVADGTGSIMAVNKAFTGITGYQPEEVIGKNPRLLKSERQDQAFYRRLWDCLETEGHWRGEIWDKKKSGEIFPTWQTITAVKDSSGRVTEYISVFSDISTIKDTEKRLLELAYHDSLTGLPNRLLFNDRLGQAIEHAKRHKSRVALLMLDLDRFKLINDTLGHAAGDRLLQLVAERLNDSIRAEDTIARLGGDEFAVVVGNLSSNEDAALLAQKIVKTISEPLALDGEQLTVSTSVGIGIYPDDGLDKETLAKSADIAMYGAKDSGRNSYSFYTPAMTDRAAEVLRIDHGLRNAILRNELVLHYQPQVSLETGSIVGVEVLVRWNHPDMGLQGPDRFIPIAEETHLIESVGDWVIDNVIRQMERWSAAAVPPVRVAINLSPRQIKRPHFVADMRSRIESCHYLDGFTLDLEVTETALQADPDIALALRELKSLGFRIAIDDFGTGYSSLNSLKQLPVDILKIDRAFVRGIPQDEDDRAITSAIIAMGHSLGMSIVAEGIETEEQLQFLRGLHCDDAQGFFFSTPVTAEECSRFLAGAKSYRMQPSLRP